ncbi:MULTISPECIES: histone-like nucleoid-structuring protein Lsr2 [unclassified Microbacterium]|uniref:histone-like nucleoid-structuring protein Lsr2 n=1 Tax=unclassified Microbacterium TaxID=2609290 RepID=UPI001ACDAE6B|nr:Lsr2 family protein [Microbacterium sp.]MBN9157470.1 Lsr2 family protein [Microbacterium sp.]MBS1897086.1 Lsr2 family protein [Actinomycetota bacterium]MBS1899314.1 Lsr2 family protein [Actinomycetota bacterium]
MARKIVHQLVDDIDGTVLEVGEGETVHFSLDGSAYEIDLTSAHAAELRAALASYISSARRTQRAGGGRPSAASKRPNRNPETASIRAWASENGHKLSERGRIPADVVAAYRAAH